jgi:hypothetical protein
VVLGTTPEKDEEEAERARQASPLRHGEGAS